MRKPGLGQTEIAFERAPRWRDRCLSRVHGHRIARGAARLAHRFARERSAARVRARRARIRSRATACGGFRRSDFRTATRSPCVATPRRISSAHDERSRARERAPGGRIHGGLHRASGRTRGARARVRRASARGAAARARGEVPGARRRAPSTSSTAIRPTGCSRSTIS